MLTKEELTEKFLKLYKIYGFKSITLDDLAREVGISKKTLYTHFKNRDEIIEQTVEFFIQGIKKILIETSDINNSIERLVIYYFRMIEYLKGFKMIFFVSLRKFHKQFEGIINDFTLSTLKDTLEGIIKSGIDDGLIRKDLPLKHITQCHLNYFNMYIYDNNNSSESFPEISADSFLKLILINIRGMSTHEGNLLLESMKLPEFKK